MKALIECIGFKILACICLFTSLLFNSCENSIQMVLPEGPSGKSAYEIWVEEVNEGTLVWDKDHTTTTDFFLYLKGSDGKNGNDGESGTSAYELWVQEVAKGTDDPHNIGNQWDKSKISMQDFWYYLTGASGENGQDGNDGNDGQDGNDGKDGTNGTNGISAYELWKNAIKTLTGLVNPHDQTQNWDSNKDSLGDFWEYLRGADGKDGIDGNDGETGTQGETVVIVKGMSNVISEYSYQDFNEFVRPIDGSVSYVVYNDDGAISPYAVVTGIPGVLDQSKSYTADIDGKFLVPKEDLPLDANYNDRIGYVTNVKYKKSDGTVVEERSASNTYTPNRMQVRLVMKMNNGVCCQTTYDTYFKVQRRTRESESWEDLPSYLGNGQQYIRSLSLSNSEDPNSYDKTTISTKYLASAQGDILNGNYVNILITRKIKKSNLMKISDDRLWDENNEKGEKEMFMTYVLDSYYGEQPNAKVIIKMAPVQYVPSIKKMIFKHKQNASTSTGDIVFFNSVYVEFDDSKIDRNIIFLPAMKKEEKLSASGESYDYFTPVVDTDEVGDKYGIRISGSDIKTEKYTSLRNAFCEPTTPYLNNSISLISTDARFFAVQDLGYINELSDSSLKIAVTNNTYIGGPIEVEYQP